jgi:hypothetical protein
MTVRALLGGLRRALFPCHLNVLDVLARTASREEEAAAKARHPASGGDHNGPITACPICGEVLICRLAAEELLNE